MLFISSSWSQLFADTQKRFSFLGYLFFTVTWAVQHSLDMAPRKSRNVLPLEVTTPWKYHHPGPGSPWCHSATSRIPCLLVWRMHLKISCLWGTLLDEFTWCAKQVNQEMIPSCSAAFLWRAIWRAVCDRDQECMYIFFYFGSEETWVTCNWIFSSCHFFFHLMYWRYSYYCSTYIYSTEK